MSQEETLELTEYINQELKKELSNLRTAYEKAVAEGKESFIYEGEEMLTSYTKYFLEYHESQLKTP